MLLQFLNKLWNYFEQWINQPIDDQNKQPQSTLSDLNPKSFKHFNCSQKCTKTFNGLGKNLIELNIFLERILLPLLKGGRKIYPGIFTDYILTPTTVFQYFCDTELNYIDEIEQIELFINVAEQVLLEYQEYINHSRSKQQNLSVLNNFHDELNEFISELIRISSQ